MSAPVPAIMRACVITAPGGPEVLALRDVPRPRLGPDGVVVRVRASALNRADLLQRMGRYPAPPGAPTDIPGLEFAGEIAEVGAHVVGWEPGDRVFGIVGGGAHADYVAVHAGSLAPVPDGMPWPIAGATPEAFITAHDALVTQGGLARGERVLIHAIGSGVGLAATQLARMLGAEVFGTARSAAKLDAARAHGMHEGVVPMDGARGIAEAVLAWSNEHGVDVVLDLVGGAYVAESLRCVAARGRYLLVGLVAGTSTTIDLSRLLRHRIHLMGTVLRARSSEEKAEATAAFVRDVLPGLATGALSPVLVAVVPLERIAEGHARLEENATIGKIAVTMD
ncbi:MAG: NAD(P)H-quinone oxidoreductase [Gemmatimonadaceae bacterium]|jgi:putative PIG3 family NAD(P)H quinone oxidoreductase|nr:NAD(P)H-quinone oxidoreductase [Gemmatimonadaceae bacterium]